MIHAVTPLKQLSNGKRRLGGALSSAERVELIRTMSARVISVLASMHEIASVSVVTNDETLVPMNCARIEDPGSDLNAAAAHAGRILQSWGASSMLVIAADLPFVTAEDIRCLIAAGRTGAAVFAADSKGLGTNAILMSPPALFQPCFGEHSLAAHLAIARQMGVSARIVQRSGLARDIDEPEDLPYLIQQGGSRYSFLQPGFKRLTE
ncbi:MAG TPA: 2-phospho-L-lactate guanylyltransferase [Steroidobacter sp.]|uniref:2-phospho-L-lactate guanylyltransferase n=1 Tax=Steroidobacter sp. TaxID=1978227 RepID=UPI002EDAAD51